ncbi:hypothetical protein ANCCAN_13983 [Ancylostoma caninum]|uniref:Uncharacterized protein n=1 Tax=Ancylostoma caninum TaxID=29170 RepID=A0A368G6Q1_ANCCA|nr:hypothetical protein ANCCAN_13983 [Ancylostoma caninum]
MKNEAEWIYDLDDGFVPLDDPCNYFDCKKYVSGLQYRVLHGETIRDGAILRSYFSQKLLHLLGESSGIYPTPNVQIRHGIYKDVLFSFAAEHHSSGRIEGILSFLKSWKCEHGDIAQCMMILSEEFAYKFPTSIESTPELDSNLVRNCRRVLLDLAPSSASQYELAERKISYFNDLNAWCSESHPSGKPLRSLSARRLAVLHSSSEPLAGKQRTVLVIISNHPWRTGIGLLQRIHQPFFGLTIFCGTYNKRRYDERGYPPKMDPLNFIEVDESELNRGYFLYYCLAKVAEMRLRNVQGYFVTADDLIFNFWYVPTNSDVSIHPFGVGPISDVKIWYHQPIGTAGLERVVTLFKETYAQYPVVQEIWRKFERGVLKYSGIPNATDFLLAKHSFYVPSTQIQYFADFMEIFFEAGVYKAIAMVKFLGSVDYIALPMPSVFIQDSDRVLWAEEYRTNTILLHPVKPTLLRDRDEKEKYCSVILKSFREVLIDDF